MNDNLNKLIAIYSEKKTTVIKHIDGGEWYELDFVLWLLSLMETSNRPALEWLVYQCLRQEDPPISIGRGKELLNFDTMIEMREWMNSYDK